MTRVNATQYFNLLIAIEGAVLLASVIGGEGSLRLISGATAIIIMLVMILKLLAKELRENDASSVKTADAAVIKVCNEIRDMLKEGYDLEVVDFPGAKGEFDLFAGTHTYGRGGRESRFVPIYKFYGRERKFKPVKGQEDRKRNDG